MVATPVQAAQALVLWLDQVRLADVPKVGGKNASLGEMIQQLTPKGIAVPSGFATTAAAYRHFVQYNQLDETLRDLFADLDVNDVKNLQQRGRQARSLLLHAPFPPDLEVAIRDAYRDMCNRYGPDVDVAVRSSATAEDLPDASFAGQQETYLNVHSEAQVMESCKKCFASIFTDRAISYRQTKGFDHFEVALSVCVQKMVRSDLATSGVMFSIDTETGFKNAVLITAAYGLGENVVQGTVNPDEYRVFKPTLKDGHSPILSKHVGSKALRMIYDTGGTKLVKNVSVPPAEQQQYALSDDEILTLARWTCQIEDHYTEIRGTYSPMDIEWAKDGLTGDLYIVQARPETVQSQRQANVLRTYHLENPNNIHPLVVGRAVGEMVGSGEACVILDVNEIDHFPRGGAGHQQDRPRLGADHEAGGRHRHRPGGTHLPRRHHCAGVGDSGDRRLRQCHQRDQDRSRHYRLLLRRGRRPCLCREAPFSVEETALDNLPTTRTKVMMNVGNPELAFSPGRPALRRGGSGPHGVHHCQPHSGASPGPGELRHPGRWPPSGRLPSSPPATTDKPEYFVDKLAQGVGTIGAAFYPKPVVVRLSDFKSNEYANLLGGGNAFEPEEENPMIGWRGASRYYDDRYRAAFALECQALKRVRDDMGLTNVILMVPFCRTPDEGRGCWQKWLAMAWCGAKTACRSTSCASCPATSSWRMSSVRCSMASPSAPTT
jgi:pyruvate,water dikinase